MNRHKVRPSRVFWSWKRGPRLSAGTSFLSLVLLFCVPAWAQLVTPTPPSPAAQTELPKDALGRTTPQGTVLGFLIAARKGDNELAARYLNTTLRGERATGLAHQLFTVLDRRLPPRLNQLSDKPEGSLADPLEPELRRQALAVEPMTCPPNAFVTGDDLLVLAPGEAVTHTWGIQAS